MHVHAGGFRGRLVVILAGIATMSKSPGAIRGRLAFGHLISSETTGTLKLLTRYLWLITLCLTMNTPHRAVIALGSNLGDRFQNIEVALRLLEEPNHVLSSTSDDIPQNANVDVVNTSFMYETGPMYVPDQPAFINCACIVSLLYNSSLGH